MTLISTKPKIAPAVAIIVAIATGAVPALHAQSRLPHQGGLDPSALTAPPSSGGALSQDASLGPPPSAGDMPDDAGFQPQMPLAGTVDGKDYVAPTGAYRIRIPVYPELGGQVNDTPNVVTFQDAYGDHSSIGCFPLDGPLRIEEINRGRKDFLVWFFQNFIQSDFQRAMPGTTAMPDARYNTSVQGGALFTQLLIPDGSVYADRVFLFPPNPPPVAKRGNLVFERDGFVYVLSMELTERIFEHDTWKKTDAEEEAILSDRLYDLLSRMVFAKPKPPVATPAMPAAPANASTPPALPAVAFPAPTTPSTTGTSGAGAAK